MSHPLGMEADPGKEVWNYPLYSYNTSFAKRNGGRQVEVKMTARWANSVNRESNDNVHNARDKYFHYLLNLDSEGRITGGYYYRGSQLDMLWVPLTPKQPGGEGNKRGNPYLNAEEVVSIWRDSISSDIVDKWVNIDVARPQVDETPDTDSQLAAADTSDAPTEAAAAEAVEEPAEAETVVDEAGAEDSEAAADSAAGEVEVTAAEVAS
jgi:hypothetical protein